MWMWQEALLQNFVKFGLNLTFFAPWLPWQWPPFCIFPNPQKLPHTTLDIPTKLHDVWWKESKIILNPPFFVSMATAAKFVQRISIFVGLSRSTICGCCSYQNSESNLHIYSVLNIPVKFHWFPFSIRREMCRINCWRKKERKNNNYNKKKRSKHNMSP